MQNGSGGASTKSLAHLGCHTADEEKQGEQAGVGR